MFCVSYNENEQVSKGPSVTGVDHVVSINDILKKALDWKQWLADDLRALILIKKESNLDDEQLLRLVQHHLRTYTHLNETFQLITGNESESLFEYSEWDLNDLTTIVGIKQSALTQGSDTKVEAMLETTIAHLQQELMEKPVEAVQLEEDAEAPAYFDEDIVSALDTQDTVNDEDIASEESDVSEDMVAIDDADGSSQETEIKSEYMPNIVEAKPVDEILAERNNTNDQNNDMLEDVSNEAPSDDIDEKDSSNNINDYDVDIEPEYDIDIDESSDQEEDEPLKPSQVDDLFDDMDVDENGDEFDTNDSDEFESEDDEFVTAIFESNL